MRIRDLITEDAVQDLERDLRKPLGYDAIDHMMRAIASKHDITPQELHKQFVAKHGKIPDKWIADSKTDKVSEDTDQDQKKHHADTIDYQGQTYKNTPRIISLIRRANEIQKDLPPVDPDKTRLWRGNRPEEIGRNPTFTNSLVGIALPFQEHYDGILSYIDVPTKDLAQYTDRIASAPDSEFTVSPELASTAQTVQENFADNRHPEDRGDSRRHGIPKKASLSTLDKIVHSDTTDPRKKQLAHWQANMRRGRNK